MTQKNLVNEMDFQHFQQYQHEDCPLLKCSHAQKVIELDKEMVSLESDFSHMKEDLRGLRKDLREGTDAIKELSSKITAEEANTDTGKWFIMAGIAIAGIVLARFI